VEIKAVSGIMLALLLTSMLTLASSIQPTRTEPTKIIVPDDYKKIQWAIGNASDGDTIFVRAGTYYENIIIDKTLSLVGESRSNTIIDGNRTGTVVWVQANNAVVSNFTIRNGARTVSPPLIIPGHGVHISGSRCTIVENIITNNTEDGIEIYSATNCKIIRNIITNNAYIGIEIYSQTYSGSGNILRDNSMINNTFNFRVCSTKLEGYVQDIDTSNTVNGKPIYYWVNERNKQVPPDAGYVAIINSTNITVKNLNLINNYEGVLIGYSNNILIDSVNIPRASCGITIYSSHHNNVSASTILNSHKGISLKFSNNNRITDTTILGSTFGVFLEESINNLVSGNTIVASYSNIWISASHYNRICQNSVSDSSYAISIGGYSHDNLIATNLIRGAHEQGVSVYDSNGNTIINNTIGLNNYGIYFCRSTGNVIHHNDIINNINQAFDHIGGNTYDNGYPSGGNYWSDYNGTDLYSGPYQNETGSDGIGDTLYTPHHNVRDRYPLMEPYFGIHDIAVTNIATSKTVVGQGYPVSINVTIENQGTFTETFNALVYANTTVIGTLVDITLESRNSITLTFTWSTTGVPYGNYTISAYATPVSDEIDTINNKFIHGCVLITLKGDADFNRLVEMPDFYIWRENFGKSTGEWPSHVNPDFDSNGLVELSDFFKWRENFGATVP